MGKLLLGLGLPPADLANERVGGAVRANIMEDRETRRSRGSGTVLFDSEDAAAAAIEVNCPRFTGSHPGPLPLFAFNGPPGLQAPIR